MLSAVVAFITSPPAQLAAGLIVAGIIWKVFKQIDELLTSDTKLEIAIWLLGREISAGVKKLLSSLTSIADRIFGTKLISWKSAVRSVAITCAMVVAMWLWLELQLLHSLQEHHMTISWRLLLFLTDWSVLPVAALSAVIPAYLILLKSRAMLATAKNRPASRASVLMAVDLAASLIIAAGGVLATAVVAVVIDLLTRGAWMVNGHPLARFYAQQVIGSAAPIIVGSSLASSAWLLLYVISGNLVRLARRIDIGFQWLNSKFDIEHKPLQVIGFMAASAVAVGWWTTILVSQLAK